MVTPATTVDEFYGGNRTLTQGPRLVERETMIVACTACEFCLDLRTPQGRDKTSLEMIHDMAFVVKAHKQGGRIGWRRRS